MPIRKNKISYTLDLKEELDNLKPSQRKTAAEAVGLYLLDSIVQELDAERSPVDGGSYKKGLSKKYKEKKRAAGKGTKADLQLDGDMLGNVSIKATKNSVTLQITNNTEKKKAFNHNTGDTLPARQFLPDDENNQVFKRKITKRIDTIIKEFGDG